MKGILLHVCCGPCAVVPVRQLRVEGMEPTAFFFNPNIQPVEEYDKRLEAVRRFADIVSLQLEVVPAYKPDVHIAMAERLGPARCAECYAMRLELAAAEAKHLGFSSFTTTLLYSPFQKHELILEAGRSASQRFGIEFLERDWRDDYRDGVEESRAIGLYRQKYCGCLASRTERFGDRADVDGQ